MTAKWHERFIFRAGWSGPRWRDAWYGRGWLWIGPYVIGSVRRWES